MLLTTPGGTQVYYEIKGEGETLLLLHGWGGNSQMLRPLLNYFCGRFRVISLDLPGFGRSSIPRQTWGSRQYAQCIRQIIRQLQLAPCHIIAHSFGGRIAIALAAQHPELVNKLVLTASAGLPPQRKLDYYFKVYLFKLSKKLLNLTGSSHEKLRRALAQRIGSADYISANPKMRSILVKVVNEDLTEFLPRIKAPTLLLWGENDQATPAAMGELMNQLIPDSNLIVFPETGHFTYLESPSEFCSATISFLGKD